MTNVLHQPCGDDAPADPTDLTPGATHERLAGGELNAALTRAVVGVYRERVGRGPTRAQAFFRDDVVIVLLRDVLTTGERSLAMGGRPDTVKRLRGALQAVMRDDMVAAVEALTRSTVSVAMSQSHVDPDMAVEVFVLDRPVGAAPARESRSFGDGAPDGAPDVMDVTDARRGRG
jgi:uncharacterized protein YbcI